MGQKCTMSLPVSPRLHSSLTSLERTDGGTRSKERMIIDKAADDEDGTWLEGTNTLILLDGDSSKRALTLGETAQWGRRE